MKIPQRQSLLKQTTEILRKAISDGTWNEGVLPGERALSKRLQVSRPTLRAALDILEREKRIKTTPGKLRKILKKTQRRKKVSPPTVILISQVPRYAMSNRRQFLFDHLHRALEQNHIHFEVVNHSGFGGRNPKTLLKPFEETQNNQTYLLALTSREVQQWFSDRGLPCLIIGSSFPEIKIPTIECDYPATGRHAAGTLLGRGHRKLLVLSPKTNLAGDEETEASFLQTVSSSTHAEVECRMLHYKDRSDILQQWKALSKLKSSSRPTGIFSLYPPAVMTLVSHLLIAYARTHENLVITPHIGGVTYESQMAAYRFMAEKLLRHIHAWDPSPGMKKP